MGTTTSSEATSVSTVRAVRFLLSYLKRHAVSLTLGFIALVAVDMLQLLIPRIVQRILDRLGGGTHSPALIVKNSLLILLMAAGMVVLRYLWRLFIVKPSRQIEERMRLDMFDHLERLSSPFFNRTKTGDLMALFVNDIGAIRMATGMALIGLFDAVFMSVMSLAFMIAIDPALTLCTAAPLPLIGFLFLKISRSIERRYDAVQHSFGDITTHVQESFSGIRVIKGFAQEENELARFRVPCDAYVERNVSLTKVWGLIFPAITFLASLSFALLLFFGGRLALTNRLSFGEFVSFTFYINLLVWPMIATGWVFNIFQRGIASTKRVLELLDSQPDVRVTAGEERASREPPLRGHLVFRGLSFRYAPGLPDALTGITLDIPAGSSVGIIGKPGSGKTTLASLLFHLYPLPRGALLIDGTDINDIPLSRLRRSIAYVPQDSFLFSDTIASNIAFALDAEGSRASIEEAARLAAVERDIMEFRQGYDTKIGERGITLSGGQKQRVAIARALMVSWANILILDDALSSVDVATEAHILKNLRGAIHSKTSLIIAHRVSTVKQCDTVIVLSGGRIVEAGTHDELVRGGAFYAKLYHLQRLKEAVA